MNSESCDQESLNQGGSIFSIEDKSECAPDYLQQPFTLIITDCNMPVMDGLEMGFEIKKYYDDFIKSFVKIKKTQILGVNKQYIKIKEKFENVVPLEDQEDFDNDFKFIINAFEELLTI